MKFRAHTMYVNHVYGCIWFQTEDWYNAELVTSGGIPVPTMSVNTYPNDHQKSICFLGGNLDNFQDNVQDT